MDADRRRYLANQGSWQTRQDHALSPEELVRRDPTRFRPKVPGKDAFVNKDGSLSSTGKPPPPLPEDIAFQHELDRLPPPRRPVRPAEGLALLAELFGQPDSNSDV